MGSQPTSDLPNIQGRDHCHPLALLDETRTQHSAAPGGLQQEAGKKSENTLGCAASNQRGCPPRRYSLGTELNTLASGGCSLPCQGSKEGSQSISGWYTTGAEGAGPEVGVPTAPHHLQRGYTRPGNTCSVLGGMSFNIEAMGSPWPSHPQQLSLLPPRFQGGTFPGGSVVKNPPASAGDTGSIPGPGRFHRRSNEALLLQLLRPVRLQSVLRNERSHRREKPAHRN